MAFEVSQTAFDEAVQENQDILDLSHEEAVTEAIKHFEAQGADLSGIITDPDMKKIQKLFQEIVKKLEECDAESVILENLRILKEECDKDIKNRVLAAKANAYSTILGIVEKWNEREAIKIAAFKALISLMTKQPDILEAKGIALIHSDLANEDNGAEIKKLVLKWLRECLIMHEHNRSEIWETKIFDLIKPFIDKPKNETIRDALAVTRALCLDDDIRVEVAEHFKRACSIADSRLATITQLLEKFKEDVQIITDILMTIAELLVKADLCKTVEEAGGIPLIANVLKLNEKNEKIARHSFRVLKSLCGNDATKAAILQNELASTITAILDQNKRKSAVVAAGLSCIAAVTLRSPTNSKALFEAGIPEIIIDSMKLHPDEKSVQRSGSWAIRNMVSRSRYQNPRFLELGAEEVLANSLGKFDSCDYDIKLALRDLECKIELIEEWTGKGGKLHTDSTTNATITKPNITE